MHTLTEQERKDTYYVLGKDVLPSDLTLSNKYNSFKYEYNNETGYIEVSIEGHKHYVYIVEEDGEKYYKVVPYPNDCYKTKANDGYNGFITVVFALWELYNPSQQVKY